MASGRVLRQLVRAGATGDPGAFQEATKAIIQEERQKQHHLLANDLEKILYGDLHRSSGPPQPIADRVPADSERGLPLMAIRNPVRGLEEIVLADEAREAVEDILEQHQRADVLKSYGLRPSDKVLFYGPPGCGKTLSAEVLATELGRPLALVRLDSLVSSYLGETAANLRKVFDFIDAYSLVVLFDEFDALGKERADTTEHGELKRVVNAVLQMLDAYQGRSIIIAATNHEEMLDSAIWRRFDEVIFFQPPTRDRLVELLHLKLRGVRREFEPDDDRILSMLDGGSHADVERVIRSAIKNMVLKNQEFLRLHHIERAYEKELSGRKRHHGE